jgi:PAT family beta-lactamase induction signal transducer AmpG
MLVCQAVIILGLLAISTVNPAANLPLMAAIAVIVGFATATQDIVIDAWRIEVVDTDRQGQMAVAVQWGYRGAMIMAGAVPLLLAERFGWNISYLAMAGAMLIGVISTLAAPREEAHASGRSTPTASTSPRRWRSSSGWRGWRSC